ncbi:hypothetical protein GCM10009726_37520 [Nocardioides furvisabuli]|uniref:Uncharacterized protein n=1 Tax=Nocardioides furvisabuli TaxID=375542 RepID=A0ABP5JMP8_9ACTN
MDDVGAHGGGAGEVEGGLHRGVGQRTTQGGCGDQSPGDGEQGRGRHRDPFESARESPTDERVGGGWKSTGAARHGLAGDSRGKRGTDGLDQGFVPRVPGVAGTTRSGARAPDDIERPP